MLVAENADKISEKNFFKKVVQEEAGERYKIHEELINPQLVKYLKIIGFDKRYCRAEGCYLYDEDGNTFLDFIGGYGVFNVGRNHPRIKKAIQEIAELDLPNLVQMDAPILSAVLAKKLLCLVSAKLDMVFFSNSGSEAVEGAIKFARHVTGKKKIISCSKSFHGMTYGSLSLMDNPFWKEGFGPFLSECKSIGLNELKALEDELSSGDAAGFIVEPVQAEGGVRPAKEAFLKEAQKLCRRHGALFILDEIQTGLGRTGKMFAMDHNNLSPDILLLGKGLGGGMVPVSAILTKKEVLSRVFGNVYHFDIHHHTFCQNNLAMAAAIATLDIIKDEKLAENADKMGTILLEGLTYLKNKYNIIKEIRGRGLMIGIEFDKPQSRIVRTGFNFAGEKAQALYTHLFIAGLFNDYGILTQLCSNNMATVKLSPPLVISEEEVMYFLKSFKEILDNASRFPSHFWTKGFLLLGKAKKELG